MCTPLHSITPNLTNGDGAAAPASKLEFGARQKITHHRDQLLLWKVFTYFAALLCLARRAVGVPSLPRRAEAVFAQNWLFTNKRIWVLARWMWAAQLSSKLYDRSNTAFPKLNWCGIFVEQLSCIRQALSPREVVREFFSRLYAVFGTKSDGVVSGLLWKKKRRIVTNLVSG